MTYADLAPEKVDVMQAIPPPANYKLPKAIKSKMTEDQRKIAESKFIHKAANSYYAEWFWFPYNPRVFVNCWYELKLVLVFLFYAVSFNLLMMVETFRNNTTESNGYQDYPSPGEVVIQWMGSVAADVLNKSFGSWTPGWLQGDTNGKSRQIPALLKPNFAGLLINDD